MGVMRRKILEAWEWGLKAEICGKWRPLASGRFKGKKEPPDTICREDDTGSALQTISAICALCPMRTACGCFGVWNDARDFSALPSFQEKANSPRAVKAAKAVLGKMERRLKWVQGALAKERAKAKG